MKQKEVAPPKVVVKPAAAETPGEFLKNLLEGGSMLKSNIASEGERHGIGFSELISAREEIGAVTMQIRGVEYWRLAEY